MYGTYSVLQYECDGIGWKIDETKDEKNISEYFNFKKIPKCKKVHNAHKKNKAITNNKKDNLWYPESMKYK